MSSDKATAQERDDSPWWFAKCENKEILEILTMKNDLIQLFHEGSNSLLCVCVTETRHHVTAGFLCISLYKL